MLGTRTVGTRRSATPRTIRHNRPPAASNRSPDTPGRAAASSLLAGTPRAAVTPALLPIARPVDHSSGRVIPKSQWIERWRYKLKIRIPGESRDPLFNGVVAGKVDPGFRGFFRMFLRSRTFRRSHSARNDPGIRRGLTIMPRRRARPKALEGGGGATHVGGLRGT